MLYYLWLVWVARLHEEKPFHAAKRLRMRYTSTFELSTRVQLPTPEGPGNTFAAMDLTKDKSAKEEPAKVDHDITVKVFPPGPNSQALLKRLGNAIGQSNYLGLYGIALNQGSGPYMMDLDGNVYLDCLAGASVNILG